MSTKNSFLLQHFARCIFAILFLLVWLSATYSTNYFVSTSGSDQNNGRIDSPFGTIQKACDTVTAGDTVYIRDGVYRITQQIRFKNSGQPNKWIVFSAYNGEKVVIDGMDFIKDTKTGNPPSWHQLGILQIEDVSYLRINKLCVVNSRNVGIMVKGKTTHHIEIINCKSDRSYGSGIALWYADSVKVLHCEIVRANDATIKAPDEKFRNETPHEALTIAGARFFEVAYNHLHLCYKEGIDCKEVSSHGTIHHNYVHDLLRQGLYADCWFGLLEDVDFYENIVHDCEWGAAISAEGKNATMRNVRMHHNVLYNNRASGIIIGVWGNNELREDIYLYNNTIVGNGTPGHWAGATGGIDVRSSNLKNLQVINNICSNNWAFEIATAHDSTNVASFCRQQKIRIENNLVDAEKNKFDQKGIFNFVYAHSGIKLIKANPMFVSPENADFKLMKQSPARNKAVAVAEFETGTNVGADQSPVD